MAKVYVGHLPQDITDQELGDIFRTYGQINKLDLKIGFAFVEYQDARDAEDAIRDLNGREIKGSTITVQVAKGPKENKTRIPKTDFRVIVEGLHQSTSWQDLKDFAREAGKPVFTDVFTRNGDRVGLIEYETFGDMDNALRKLDDADLKGNRVRVIEERKLLGRPRSQERRSPDRRAYDYDRGRSYDRGDRNREYGGRRDEYRGRSDYYYRDERRSRSRGDRGGYRDDGRRSRERDYRR